MADGVVVQGPALEGASLGSLRVGALLGQGSTSWVHRALDGDGQAVALKLLRSPTSAGSDVAARFRREFDLAREVAGPHVIAVFDQGAVPAGADGAVRLWMTMELVEGGSAADLVPRGDALPDLARVLPVLAQVAAALDAAHALDVVHRDVKPANVLLRAGPAPDAVLTDFGTAQLAEDVAPLAPHGRIAGTLPYAAPEVLLGRRLSAATDLYSLACTTVELLTGEPPFPRSTPFGITHAHLTGPPPSLRARRGWLPATLDDVLAPALAKDPADRPAGCAAFAAAVADALTGVTPRPPGRRRGRLVRRRRRP